MIISLKILGNIFKMIGATCLTNDNNYLQVSTYDNNYDFAIMYYSNDNLLLYSRKRISFDECENSDIDNLSVIFNVEKINKLIMLTNYYPSYYLKIECMFDIVEARVVSSQQQQDDIDYRIKYDFNKELIVNEPTLLRHTFVCITKDLKKLLELCRTESQFLIVELRENILIVKSEDVSCCGSIEVSDCKKKSDSKFFIPFECVDFLINRLNIIASKSCNIYFNPFVIEDVSTGICVFCSDVQNMAK